MIETKFNKRDVGNLTYLTSTTITEKAKLVTTHVVFNDADITKYNSAAYNEHGDLIQVYGQGNCNFKMSYSEHSKDHRQTLQEFIERVERIKKYEEMV
jgi:hypothetical protein